ncbi:MAG: hypothetical protein M1836_005069 [Candelina mexicana]|nr:MAG: hypothetical protein M1836_005069 [Candelina mexicana]
MSGNTAIDLSEGTEVRVETNRGCSPSPQALDSSAEKAFPLTRLSGELRNKIYAYAFDELVIFIDAPFFRPGYEHLFPNPFTYSVVWIASNRADERPRPTDDYTIKVYRSISANQVPERHYLGMRYESVKQDPSGFNTPQFQSGNYLLGLLLVSREICLEAAPILFGRPHYFESNWIITPYLKHLLPWALPYIKYMFINPYVDDDHLTVRTSFSDPSNWKWNEVFKSVAADLKLNELVLGVPIPDWGLPTAQTPQEILENVDWVKEVYEMTGLKKVRLVSCRDQQRPSLDDSSGFVQVLRENIKTEDSETIVDEILRHRDRNAVAESI